MNNKLESKMNILDHEILPGMSAQLSMNIAKLYTRTKVDIPVIIERGKKEGPCLLITGGIHGDEINGVEIVRQIITKKINKPTHGTIITIPLINVFGFINQSREFPDGKDLNRAFPGAKNGSLASRFAAYLIEEIIPHVDYCIDYHTGGAQRFNFPHLRIDDDEETLKLAKAFHPKFVQFSPSPKKTYRESVYRLGKKVLLFEGGKSLNIDEWVTKTGVDGARNVIHYLGMKDYSKEIDAIEDKNPSIIIKESKWLRSRYSGMFRTNIEAGQKIEKNDILGSVSDPFGDFEKKIKSPMAGYILNCNHSPIVNQGDALFHVGMD